MPLCNEGWRDGEHANERGQGGYGHCGPIVGPVGLPKTHGSVASFLPLASQKTKLIEI